VDDDFDETTEARAGLECMPGRGVARTEISGEFTIPAKQIFITSKADLHHRVELRSAEAYS
jgi:hypothetical protein